MTLAAGTGWSWLAAARVQPAGGLDPSFGGGTGEYIDQQTKVAEAHDAVVTDDHRVVFTAVDGLDQLTAIIRRSTPDGEAVDDLFGGGDGTVKVCSQCRIDTTAIRADGEMFAAGTSSVDGSLVLKRLTAAGGHVLSWHPEALLHAYAHGVALVPNKVVVVGDRNKLDFLVARYIVSVPRP